jgi:hypothetical protein
MLNETTGWHKVANVSVARGFHSVIPIANHSIALICGGFTDNINNNDNATSTCVTFDPSTNSTNDTFNMLSPRALHAMLDYNGLFLFLIYVLI